MHNKTTQDKILTQNSQELRRNMTKEEKHLWYDFLKKLPITVNRQRKMGNYIADFYIAKCKLVIEIDGSQHYEPENRAKDKMRDDVMRERGIEVLRYTNLDIHRNFAGVCRDILKVMERRGVVIFPSSVTCGDTFPSEWEGI